jgi:hypothetical protein
VLRAWGLQPGGDPSRELTEEWSRRAVVLVLDDVTQVCQYEWLLPVPPGCGLIICTTMPRHVVL